MDDYERYVDSNRPIRQKKATLGCGAECGKKVLMAMNLVFLGLGAAIVGVGVYVLNSDVGELTSNALPVGMIALGSIVMLISFLGCCGALKEGRAMLCCYVLFLLVLIIAQIIVAALVLSDKDKAKDIVEDGWNDASLSTRCDVQNNFDCCGFFGPSDNSTPTSVCECPKIGGTNTTVTVGCLDKLESDLEDNLELLGAIGVAFALFQIVGVVLSLCLRSAILSQYEEDQEQAALDDARKVNRSYT